MSTEIDIVVEEGKVSEGESSEMSQPMKEIFQVLGDAFGLSAEKAVKALNARNKLENVAIFVDYDNVYWTLMNYYSHDPDNEDPNKNLFERLWERYKLDNVRTFRAYADFEQVRTDLTSLQKKRIQIRHVYSNSKDGDRRKNSSDIELCIDAIESTYKDTSITCYVFVTADSDMIPIMSRLMYKGKRVELFYLSKAAPQHVDMTKYAHYSQDLLQFLNVEFKEFLVENYFIPALFFIRDWEVKYGAQGDKFLGTSWLRSKLSENLGIPANTSSELIEKMQLEEYILPVKKQLSNGTIKTSLSLTNKAKEYLDSQAEAAAGEKMGV